ncbi:glycosyltransferase family 4 protein [Kitasatospora sp. NPDC057223]|uniref:glycosyltransferase family 4 protein n=1 Tax=Kitasatospora sp. NPDC057223 TaxID=3346055 RepID=UPI00363143DF
MADRTGCGVLRVELPLQALRAEGYATGSSERMAEQLTARTLIGQRVCMPGPSARWQEIAAQASRPRLVFELDDDLWHVDSSSPVAHAFFERDDVRQRLEANIAVADAVTVTMEELAAVVRPLNPNVHVIPNYLPAWLLQHERPHRDGVVTIGWGGSATHQMDVEEIGGQLRQVMNRNPHVELHLMGSDYRKALGVRDRVRVSEWTASVPDYWRAIDYDIMLAPLRAHRFNASKSPLRPLEAAMLGIPVIASDYGPYAQFVRHGETGFLVRRDHEWGRYLRDLVNDEAMRAEMGAAGRRQAADWTIEGHVDEWQKVLLP